ncbi:uncharacterized protein LOC134683195 isoform X3 [Mytilus trossulus]|uniref:uncharacterized protein LOC134683195 isoform X3 n=1 Tax=Mytilus trossulus TaxID=6551 RepID=UPI003007E9EC
MYKFLIKTSSPRPPLLPKTDNPLSHSKVRQKPGMDGKGKCNKCEIEGQWLEDYNKGLMYNERSRPKYLPPPPMGIRVFDRYRLRTYPNPYERRPLPPARVPKHSFMRERVPHVHVSYPTNTDVATLKLDSDSILNVVAGDNARRYVIGEKLDSG